MSDPDNNFINKVSVSQSLVCIRIPGESVRNSDS